MADPTKGPTTGSTPGSSPGSAPGSSNGGPAAGSQGGYTTGTEQKKPSAIIDLKATVIGVKDTKPVEAPKPAQAQASTNQASTGGSSASVPKTGAGTSGPTSGGAKPSKPADPRPPSTSPGATAASGAPAPKKSGGIGAMFSHVAAGVLGGTLVLLAGSTLTDRLGLNRRPAATTGLEQRLAVLEQATKAGGAPVAGDAGPQLAAAEARLTQVDKLVGDMVTALAELKDGQTRQVADTKALTAKVETPLAADAVARLTRLEDNLTSLSALAKDPQAGRIPQLAQLSGKIIDLEAALSTQLAATRKSITAELDNRLTRSAATSEAAQSGTVRIDKDLATVKTEAARTAQSVEALGANLKAVQADATVLKANVDDLTGQLKLVSRPQDVAAALAPVTSKLSGLEQNVQGVVKQEDDRRSQSERMVLALELGNLKRALDRGGAYAAELSDVEKMSGGKLNLAGLAKYKDTGVPTLAGLANDFRAIAFSAITADAAPASGGVVDQLLASAKRVVSVRKTAAESNDKSAEAVVARIDAALKAGRLADIATEAQALSARAKAVADPWLAKVELRGGVDRAIGELEASLKASLSGKALDGKVKP
jgi:hypothetical protein